MEGQHYDPVKGAQVSLLWCLGDLTLASVQMDSLKKCLEGCKLMLLLVAFVYIVSSFCINVWILAMQYAKQLADDLREKVKALGYERHKLVVQVFSSPPCFLKLIQQCIMRVMPALDMKSTQYFLNIFRSPLDRRRDKQ